MELLYRKSKIFEYIMIAIGTTLMAVAVNFVFEPMEMVTGGVSGLAIVIKYWTGSFFEGGVPIWLSNLLTNVPLFIMAILLFGKRYIAKTLYATACFTFALYLVPTYSIAQYDFVLAAIYGGILMGVGLGLVFSTNCSTGGTDLLGAIVQVKFKHYSVPKLLMMIDSCIVLLGAAVFGMNKALYAIIAVYITSKIMDGILEGLKFGKLAYIISDSHEEIANTILTKLDRGVTGIPIKGMYSNNDKNMLLCVVSKKEIVGIIDTVAQIDPSAFVIVSDVREVLGEGFIEYKQ